MLTRDQKYAGDVLDRVRRAQTADGVDRTEYKAMAQELPIMVRSAGLVQALAFVRSRSSAAHRQLLDDVAATVGYGNGEALVTAAMGVQLGEYVRLTERVLDALQWYKRMAQIELA